MTMAATMRVPLVLVMAPVLVSRTVMMLTPMMMLVIVRVMVDALRRPAAARVLAEQQRFDGHRHRIGRHADAPEIDVVEVPQHHAVDREDLAFDQKLLAQDCAQRLRDVAVEHDVERLPALDGGGKPVADAFGKGRDALIGRRSRPAQRQRHLALAFYEIERREMRTDGSGEALGVNDLAAFAARLQHLHIAPRQELAGFGDVAGVAVELHAVLGGAERGRANALARRQARPWQVARIDAPANGEAQPAAHVAEIALLAAIDVFADAAGEHDAVNAAEIDDRVGEIEMLDGMWQRTTGERRH